MNQDYLEAKAIILKSLKTGKLLVEFKRWEQLDTDAKNKALLDSRCTICGKIKLLTDTYCGLFGTDPCCKDCGWVSDGIKEMRKEFPMVYKDEEYSDL